MGDREHIIADSAYMLLDKVLVPFVNNGHLTELQKNYNRRLSKVRARVEHTFGRADSLWRRLFFLPCRNMAYAVDHIAASFVLHNFNILHGQQIVINHVRNDEFEEGEEEDTDDPDPDNEDQPQQGIDDVINDPQVPQGNLARSLEIASILGEQKRWDMCNLLPL